MRERVPQLRAQVSQTAFDDLQGFLTDIRDRATKIGETAMKQALTSTAADNGGTSSPDTNSDVVPATRSSLICFTAASTSTACSGNGRPANRTTRWSVR